MKSLWKATARFLRSEVRLAAILLLVIPGSFSIPKPQEGPASAAWQPAKQQAGGLQGAAYLNDLAQDTYAYIRAMVEPATGFPHDRLDASLLDLMPQLAVVRGMPYTNVGAGASLAVERCTAPGCRYRGSYGLKLVYSTPPGTWASYNIDSAGFDPHQAAFLEGWVKGAKGGEKFEFVLWSNCAAAWPGRPESAMVTASREWKMVRIPLADFLPYTGSLSMLCRLSIGFNDALHHGGTLYLDQIAFVDSAGNRVHVPVDEETNITNVGLYISSVLGALEEGLETESSALEKLGKTLDSLEALQKWHGFPQAQNHVVSLTPGLGDRCISTVDLGIYAAGLVELRQRLPPLAGRATALLDAMEWDWLYDSSAGLPYGCRYPDGSFSSWHYDWLAADSHLAHVIGIGAQKIPAGSWGNLNRALEAPRCAGSSLWHFMPGWEGGGLFMQLMPAIFLEETRSSLGISARNFVLDQICFARQNGWPAWGWSATALPPYGGDYCGYGCDPTPLGVLVPHASILAASQVSPDELVANLKALEWLGARKAASDGNLAYEFGFRASLNWKTGQVATVYLVLDQSMAFLSLVNQSRAGFLRQQFCQDSIMQQAIRTIPDYAESCAPYFGFLPLTIK